jgi:amidase
MLDYSSSVIPVTAADKEVDKADASRNPLNKIDEWNYNECEPVSKMLLVNLTSADNADLYHGAPVGLQIVTRKYEEEKAWALAKILSNALRTAGYPELTSNSNL